MRRRGFTLVETLVFGTMAMALLASSWTLFGDAIRRGAATESKLQGVQSALLLSLFLEEDLESLYEPVAFGDLDTRAKVAATGSEAEFLFHRYARESAEGTWEPLEIERVVYRFDAATGTVARQVGDGTPRVFVGRYERFNIRFSNPGQDEAPAVVYSIVGIPADAAARDEEDRSRTDRSVLVGGVSRYAVADAAAYPYWNPVPYGPPSN